MCFRPSVLFPAIFSTFGLTAFYSELWKERVPVWLGVTILTLPVGLIVIVQMGDLPVKVLRRIHFLAIGIYSGLAIGMELIISTGFRPDGLALYRAMTHLGWTFGWAMILRQTRALRSDEA